MAREYWLDVPAAVLTGNERRLLVSLSQEFNEGNPLFFGIGVMWGGSFHCMRAGNKNAIIVGLDVDYKTHQIHRPDLIDGEWLQGDSTTYEWNEPIDFLFVDGAHDYKTVKIELQRWANKVKVGGIIAFHDYTPAEVDIKMWPDIVGVNQAVNEWRNNNFVEITRVDSIVAFRRTA